MIYRERVYPLLQARGLQSGHHSFLWLAEPVAIDAYPPSQIRELLTSAIRNRWYYPKAPLPADPLAYMVEYHRPSLTWDTRILRP
jgi:hypothetical protein